MKINLNNYPGSKAANGAYQTIISHMPKHETYVEPFAGSAAIFKKKKPATYNIINDLSISVFNALKNEFNVAEIDLHSIGENHDIYFSIGFPKYCMLNTDYKYFFENSKYYEKPLFYLDPPYLKSTRRSQDDIYEHEWNDQDHIDFLEYVVNFDFPIIISCYDNFLYDLYLDGWNKTDFVVMTRKGKATETIYYNFTRFQPLHEYTYIGDNFTDRQRINRKFNRYIKNVENMSYHERLKILDALSKKYPTF